MDCRTASDLIMEYIDGEIGKEQEAALMQHLDSCKDCCFEFHSLKETVLMLNDVPMEEAPCDLEKIVISRIKKEEQAQAKLHGWTMGVAAYIVLLAGWLGLAGIILYTPLMDIAANAFNVFIYGVGWFIEWIVKTWYFSIATAAKVESLSRAFDALIYDFRYAYNTCLIVMILFVALASELCAYVQKTVGR